MLLEEMEVVGVIVSVIPLVTKLVKHFGTQRNAPRQVERLSRVLAELKDERLLDAAMPAEQKHIREMLDRCTDLLDKEMATGQKSRAWKFFWSAEAENRLKGHNDELETELGRLQLRVHMFKNSTTAPPAEHSSSRDAPSPLLGSKEYTSPPPKYRPASLPFLPRRSSVEALELPATLCLQNPYGKRIGDKIRLHTLTIIERDDVWRRIQYVGRGSGGAQVRVTHRIPRGNIWFEDEDLEDLSVSFLEPHDITIQNEEGYKVYRSYSIYQFGTVAHREEFLVHVRERQLLGRYFAEKIWEGRDLIAQQKVVRLWRKTTSRESQKTTLSFIGRDERPYERALVDFRRSPTLRDNRAELADVVGSSKTTLEFRRPPRPARTRSRLFGSRSRSSASLVSDDETSNDSDAARFKAAFEANHPATSTFSPLTLRPTGGEANFDDVPGLSPSLPALSPTSSKAPTLDTISLPPASIASLPDDLPVSPRSSMMPVIKDEDLFP